MNIERIIFINLDKRTDRLSQIQSELINYGLIDKAIRFPAIHNDGGDIGCMMSHIEVLKIAKKNNYKNVLILEDDFEFVVSKDRFYYLLDIFKETYGDNYDVLKLSYNMIKSTDTDNIEIGKIIESQTTSGYIVNNHYYDKLIDLFEKCLINLINTRQHWLYAVDSCWKIYQPIDNWYFFKDRIGIQRASYSDISLCYVNHKV